MPTAMSEPQRLTDLEHLILLSVLRLGEGALGSDMQEDLEENAHRSVTIGSIHVTMARLEDRGLVNSEMTEPRAVRGGKARRAYSVTPEGRRALEWSRRLLEDMWDGVPAREGA